MRVPWQAGVLGVAAIVGVAAVRPAAQTVIAERTSHVGAVTSTTGAPIPAPRRATPGPTIPTTTAVPPPTVVVPVAVTAAPPPATTSTTAARSEATTTTGPPATSVPLTRPQYVAPTSTSTSAPGTPAPSTTTTAAPAGPPVVAITRQGSQVLGTVTSGPYRGLRLHVRATDPSNPGPPAEFDMVFGTRTTAMYPFTSGGNYTFDIIATSFDSECDINRLQPGC